MAEKKDEKFLSAGYEQYPQYFSNKYFSAATVADTVRRLISRGFTRDNLRWGYYQKYAPVDPTNQGDWGLADYYKNWESSVEEAREALAKTPVDPNRPGPDPDSPKTLAKNMLEHLDTAVKIALFDKYLDGNSDDSGVEIEVVVGKQKKKSRRHKFTTDWRVASSNQGDPKYKYDRLTITMTCPNDGWIGTAAWRYPGAAKFTRFVATYKVPDPPKTSKDQIIFIFNGLESLPAPDRTDPPAILQPVLQWTPGNGWAIRSWYVPATYTPTIEMMPGPKDERAFTIPSEPAWTATTPVKKGDTLQGVIEWDGMTYRSKFIYKGADTAALVAENILPLTYPVAVIEAYAFKSRDELIDSVTMNYISLERDDAPGQTVEPTWTVGTDDPPEPKRNAPGNIKYGTGRMQKYKVVSSNSGATLTFTKKTKP